MAMRLLNQRELEAELIRAGLEATEIRTGIARLWRCPNGMHVTVPDLGSGRIGDYILDDLLRACGTLYQGPTH
jgi:hypothetical protein